MRVYGISYLGGGAWLRPKASLACNGSRCLVYDLHQLPDNPELPVYLMDTRKKYFTAVLCTQSRAQIDLHTDWCQARVGSTMSGHGRNGWLRSEWLLWEQLMRFRNCLRPEAEAYSWQKQQNLWATTCNDNLSRKLYGICRASRLRAPAQVLLDSAIWHSRPDQPPPEGRHRS